MQDELALIHRATDGDQDAFAQLVRAYEKPVYNLALRMSGNPEDALDLSQETFLRAWRGLGGYRFDAAFSTWLYRLTHNVCVDFLRRQKKQRTVPLTVQDEDGEERELPIPAPGGDAEETVLRRLERQAVDEALSQLEPEYRAALTLRVIDGLSYQEIAAALEIKEGTVKSRIARAREKMRQAMKKAGTNPAPLRPIRQTHRKGGGCDHDL